VVCSSGGSLSYRTGGLRLRTPTGFLSLSGDESLGGVYLHRPLSKHRLPLPLLRTFRGIPAYARPGPRSAQRVSPTPRPWTGLHPQPSYPL